jgi:ribose 5-phosphate isomerase A
MDKAHLEQLRVAISERVRDGQRIGVGTGRTVTAAILGLADAVRGKNIRIECLPTSWASNWQLQELGLPVCTPGFRGELDWGFDGADEVDARYRLIKGGGGALLQEKMMAKRCREYLIVVDESKLVEKLGEAFPVPVEFFPEARFSVERSLVALGAKSFEVRTQQSGGKQGLLFTEKGNMILDVFFSDIPDDFEDRLKSICGVAENGLFFGYVHEVYVGGAGGIQRKTVQRKK